MDIRIVHFYPELMSLYGSYANVSILKQYLELLGNTVLVDAVSPSENADLTSADFLFMGAGTERSQKVALRDFSQYADSVTAAAKRGVPQLYVGTAMELLGASITDSSGTLYEAIGLGRFTSVQSEKRIVGDVCGATDLYPEAVVGFMNKGSIISGVETPLVTSLSLGFGNEAALGAEGFHLHNVFASELTGPILVKNPRLLDAIATAIYQYRGQDLPDQPPSFSFAEKGYAITAEQLRLRSERTHE